MRKTATLFYASCGNGVKPRYVLFVTSCEELLQAMTTKNRRVVGYVSRENRAQLKKFVEQHSVTESKTSTGTAKTLNFVGRIA